LEVGGVKPDSNGRRPEDPEDYQTTNKLNALHHTCWILGAVAEDDEMVGLNGNLNQQLVDDM